MHPAGGPGPAGRGRAAPLRLLAHGDLVAENDFDLLIRAFASLARLDPRVRLLIVGEGPQRAALEGCVRAEGVAEQVSLPGAVGRARLRTWLRHAHVFVLTRRAGCGRGARGALLRPMAGGLGVVASDVGRVAGLVADGRNGLLVPPGEAGALARALQLVAGHRVLRERLGRSAASTLENRGRRRSA